MSRSLVPCSSCLRHAWSTESACPFCGGALGAPRALPTMRAGLSRAGLLLATSLAVAACGPAQPQPAGPDEDTTQNPPGDSDVVAMYGAPAPEDGVPSDPDPDSTQPDTEPEPESETPPDRGEPSAPMYGLPPPEAVPIPPQPEQGHDLSAPKYGAPPPPPED